MKPRLKLELKKFQDDFVFNPARHPAMISGWATGKTLTAILRAMIYSETIPNNLGIVFRREYTDLRDSTLKDFEQYSGIKVNSQRNAQVGDSMIMFRHVEELNKQNLQNINLGWFFIEQAEELATDEEFFMLWGRLRRKLEPSDEFLKLGLPIGMKLDSKIITFFQSYYSAQKESEREQYRRELEKLGIKILPLHSGWITGNVKGDNWIKTLWKDNPQEEFSLIEATTFDNNDVLPADYIKTLEVLKTLKPDIYKRFVENDWGIQPAGKVFKPEFIKECIGGSLEESIPRQQYVLGSDLAKHSDWAVNIVLKRGFPKQIVYFDRFNKVRWTSNSPEEDSVKSRILRTSKRYNNALSVPDSTGVGDPVVEELTRDGLNVYRGENREREGFVFTAVSKEQLIENLIIGIETRDILIPPELTILIQELKDYESEEGKGNHVRYSAPEGKFDDCVTALALAYWGLKEGQSVMSMINTLTGQRL